MELRDERHDDRALRPLQFSLRTLLLVMTVLCCLFGIMAVVGPAWSILIAQLTILVFIHVVGNAMGTRLRDGAADEPGTRRPQVRPPVTIPPQFTVGAACFRENTRVNRATLLFSLAGALAGSILGGVLLARSVEGINVAGVLVGMFSTAVLGAYAGFMAAGLARVWHRARREALADTQ